MVWVKTIFRQGQGPAARLEDLLGAALREVIESHAVQGLGKGALGL